MDITDTQICRAIQLSWKGAGRQSSEAGWISVTYNLLGMWKLIRHTTCDFANLDDIDFLMDIVVERREMVRQEKEAA